MKKIHFYILLLFIVSFNKFFDPVIFKEYNYIYKIVSFIFFIILIISIHSSNNRKKRKLKVENKKIDLFIKFLFLSLFVSIFNASFFETQDISISIMSAMDIIISYMLYFEVKKTGLDNKSFVTYIKIMGLGYLIILFINYLTLPNPLFGTVELDVNRLGHRIRLIGQYWLFFLFFYVVNKLKECKSKKYFFLLFICYLGILATLARQYIFFSTILGLFLYLKNISLFKKISLCIIIGCLFIASMNTKFYKGLENITTEQITNNKYNEEDIRIRDYKYYCLDYNRNILQYMFGCGWYMPNYSQYGRKMLKNNEDNGMYQVDTGWAGFVFFYGYIPTILLILLIIICLRMKIDSSYVFYKYFLLYCGLTAIASDSVVVPYEYMMIILTIYFIGYNNCSSRNSRSDLSINIK